MKDINDLFLTLSCIEEIFASKAFIKKLYFSFNNFFEIFTSDFSDFNGKITQEEREKIQTTRKELKKIKLSEIKKTLELKKIKFLAYCEKDYPAKLKDISDSPFCLFYRGNLELLKKSKTTAIVGTRAATKYGINVSNDIASLLAKQGIVIISGLASGIDTSAHAGAITSGKTIAVLGTGVDIIFPVSNEKLSYEILDKDGLIVSEYPPGAPGLPWNFPQRNRIISALSDAVVIIEGDVQSGAMITARFAIKQGKPLFALPGPIDSSVSNGPNILIKSGVAELLVSVNDILEKIGEEKQIKLELKNNEKPIDKLNEREKKIYKMLSGDSKGFDILLQETELSLQELTRELSILELKGLVEKTPDGGYVSI